MFKNMVFVFSLFSLFSFPIARGRWDQGLWNIVFWPFWGNFGLGWIGDTWGGKSHFLSRGLTREHLVLRDLSAIETCWRDGAVIWAGVEAYFPVRFKID
ncbi:hypothetical protein BDP55DRAFT_678762 [Colletotrichum godetiae]|uniref:Uncharacterized protein n=1 Tax=Colletotrichum godetiae TaxID=1209918 RepID=A0AAJ0ESM6_9PEZI|nr:uncharacterized protein BDP55DRAFT_678762 [Colletotrichum godetiae]KAK1659704.1 hypothetical protein BDP55DRAFT_678762 [Colletotrichum godetiae]